MLRNQKFRDSLLRLLSALCVCALFCSFLVPTASAEETKTVRVGYMLMENFEEGGQGEIKSGYGYEYLQMLRNYTGWEYEYVYGGWEELVTMLESGEIDLLSHVARTPNREGKMLFSLEPQGRENHYLYVCGSHSTIDTNDLSTLNGKAIGSIRGDFRRIVFEDWCQTQGITCNIVEYTDLDQMHKDLHDGVLDAISEGRQSISAYSGDWRGILRLEDTPVYFAVNKNRPDLLAEIDAAQAEILQINEYFGEELQQKYLSDISYHAPDLSEEEALWLAEAGVLRVGYCEGRRPLAYTDDQDQLNGLLKDYLAAMTEHYGISFQSQPYDNDVALLEALKQGEVDIIAPVGYHYGMAENSGVSITNPITVEAMLAVFKGYAGTEKKDIYQRIAVQEHSVTEKDYARRHYPSAILVEAKSAEQAIDFVDKGIADCYMVRSTTYSWYKGEYDLLNDLQIATLPNSSTVNMAVLTENVALISILNKGISLLDSTDINQSIVAYSDAREGMTWLRIMEENPFTTIAILAAVLSVVLLFVTYRLRTEYKYATQLREAKEAAEKAQSEAERANLAKSTFLTSMSHDIRTPMNAIIGMTTLASRHLTNPDYVRNCLGKVTMASNHLLTLINDVLDINKIESGNLTLTPTVFSLADSVMNLANIGRHQLQEKNHHFEIRVHDIQQEYLFADELRINQVFINLLSNAIKYTPVGGHITIDVK